MLTGNFVVNSLNCLFGFVALASGLAFQASAQEQEWTIYTDTYRPYVLPEGDVRGSGMKTIELVMEDTGQKYQFRYIDYSYAVYAAEIKSGIVSFPWRKTSEREARFHFSRPLFKVETRVFFNRQAFPDGMSAESLNEHVFGEVEAYAYTGEILARIEAARARPSGTKVYGSDSVAIRALLANEIDVLPLPASVVEATLQTLFPDQVNLLDMVDGVSDTYPLHMIAPKTEAGAAFIQRFDRSHSHLTELGIIAEWNAQPAQVEVIPGEIAKLISSEGFPVILGCQADEPRTECSRFLAIPQGTRALILEWSGAIQRPTKTDQIYKTMVDETRVLILNGPHIAEELWVKNMHIEIVE